jgi:hypothetical protein
MNIYRPNFYQAMTRPKKRAKKASSKVVLLLPTEKEENISKGKWEDLVEYIPKSIDGIMDWFKQYQVDTIELWIGGAIETKGITSLFISAKGEGGVKVVLKPKTIH